MKTTTVLLLLLSLFISCPAQSPTSERQHFIRVEAPLIALTHVRVIDGTGAAPRDDQTIIIADGKIQSVGITAIFGRHFLFRAFSASQIRGPSPRALP